ncbi:response regulator [Caulobacter sp. 17J65-9]|uniref:response regulator n=1 Tax=Caulobacter sp. 17J65-9 TaxID=2709382 RepID=UPI0013C90DEB|nr:response regulator [Caulobacter sp. 17J65-9]NEX92244.1 response regulator [Caulobacter sp. 17J65-9]
MQRPLAPDRPRAPGARAAAVLGVVLAAFLTATGIWLFHELEQARALKNALHADIEHRRVLGEAQQYLESAESAELNYALTGQPAFRREFEVKAQHLVAQWRILATSLAAEPAQKQRLDELHALVTERLDNMREVMRLRDQQGQPAAQRSVASGAGEDLMRRTREGMEAITQVEDATITRGLREQSRSADRIEWIVVVQFLGLGVGAAVIVFLVRRHERTRKALLYSIESQYERQRAVFDAATDGILLVTQQGLIENANPAAERLFGYEEGELDGVDTRQIRPPNEADGALSILWSPEKVQQGGYRRDVTGQRKDGSTFPMEVSVTYAHLPEGERAVIFIRDISSRREVERLKDEFVSTVSHELRTPLTSIAGSLGLVAGGAAGPLPEKAARLIGIAQSNSQRLVRLINDMLDLEKLESGTLPFLMAPIDLAETATRAIDAMRGYADQFGVELALEPGPPVKVRADSDRLVQILNNLISNAVKYSPRGDAVRVRVAREGSKARVSVVDAGPGIPAAFRDRIFTRFAQADASDARGKGGTGLGLHIAKGIAERHGGRLWFESPEDGGTAFHLDLPALDDAPEQPRDRVLLVEDDALASAMLQATLEDEGLKVDSADTLAEARKILAEGRHGALVLDLRLPDGDGMDLVRELRTRPETRGMPVVIVSGESARGRARDVRALEVTDWIEKPVDPDRLADLVRNTVGQAAPGATVVLHVDDDPDIREIVATALRECCEVLSVAGLAEARACLAERKPDLVILDLELQDGSGLDLLPELKTDEGAPIPVVVFSAQDTSGDLSASVAAVLVKSRTSLADLVSAVHDVVREEGSE